MGKLLVVDFKKQELIREEEIILEKQDWENDSVLVEMHEKLDESNFEMYRRTVEHYLNALFVKDFEKWQKIYLNNTQGVSNEV